MDQDTQDLLKSWGFEQYIDVFKENEIDIVALSNMEECHLKELVPAIGARIKLKLHLKDWKGVLKLTSDRISDASFGSDISFQDSNYDADSVSLSAVCDPKPSVSNAIAHSIFDAPATNIECSASTSFATPFDLNPSASNARAHSTVGVPTTDIKFQDLNAILKKSPNGQLVLTSYKEKGKLDSITRRRLCEVVVNYLITLIQEQKIKVTNDVFKKITAEIVKIFPNEHENTYFIKPLTEGRHQLVSRGKLVDRFRNKIRELRVAGVIPNERKKRKVPEPTYSVESPEDDNIDVNGEEIESVEWLKRNVEPWTTVREHWRRTVQIRRKKAVEQTSSVFEEWPVLKQPLGYNLIEIDFEQTFPEKNLLIYSKWTDFSKKARAYMEVKLKDVASKQLLSQAKGEISQDALDLTTFLLLPAVCPPRGKIKSPSGGNWRPTVIESRESFILQVNVPGQLKEAISTRQKKMMTMKMSVQPQIVVVGSSVNPEAFYVSCDNIIYKVESILKAVDICFKLFHVFHLKYPLECEQVWLLLQKGIYEMDTKWDKQLNAVQTVLCDINNEVL